MPGGVYVQAGWNSEQPGLMEGVLAHSRRLKAEVVESPF